MHLDDGKLRALLDGELAAEASAGAVAHLQDCAACRARLDELQARAARLGTLLARLDPGREARLPSAQSVLANVQARRSAASAREMVTMQRLFSERFRSVWIGVGALAALIVALSFAPVRTWAAGFLGLFRVQQITVLPVDATRFSALNDDASLGDQISRMFADSVTVVREPGDPYVAVSAAEASQAAGFNVRLAGAPAQAGQIVVQTGAAFEMVVDRDLAQAVLDEAGRSDLQLPASLDGATISVDIPTGVSVGYGDCPNMAYRPESGEPPESKYAEPKDCVILAQIPSPTVNLPPDVDLTQLAEIGLQFTGMSAEEARAFSQTVDWTSTLVIPIPRNGAAYEQVAVDGVVGNLIYRNPDSAWQRYTLLWVKDGIVYGLTGYGDPQDGVALANSLQ